MLKLTILPARNQKFILACSGGSDSMAAAHFLKEGGRSFTLAYFNHATEQADEMEECVKAFGLSNNLPVSIGKIQNEKHKEQSLEEWWRIERYRFFHSFKQTIVTCHHLDDAVEGWVFSSLHGEGKVIPHQWDWILRPFLLNTKEEMTNWCIQHSVKWVEDRSNQDTHHPRNLIRKVILPECKKINPGLNKVIRKKILQQIKSL